MPEESPHEEAGVGESRSALHLDAAKRTGKIVVGPVKSGGGLSGQ